MQRIADYLERAALLAAVVLCSAGAVAAWRIGETAQAATRALPVITASVAALQADGAAVTSSVATAATGIGAAGSAVQRTAAQVRRESRPIAGQLALDLQEGHRLILEAGLTAAEARKASAAERQALPVTMAKADASLDALSNELGALHETTLEMDRLIEDPANRQTLENFSNASGTLAATAQDGERWVHGLLHPTWPHRAYHVGLDVAHALLDPF